MSRLLKALAWVSPGAAVSRLSALSAIERVRGYDGAQTGRRAGSFAANSASANTEIGPALSRLRNRSSELGRNTWAGARILDIGVGHAVGTGITAVPDTGSTGADSILGEAWEEWCARSDIEGVLAFGGQQVSSVRTMMERGEGLIRRIPLRRDEMEGRKVPLALQVMEGDFIDHSRDGGLFEGVASRLGVGLGPWGRRLGYWLHETHPGEYGLLSNTYASNFIPKDDVIHLYRPLRPGQVRGVPVFAPILMTARDLADLIDAIVVKSRTEACFAGFVKSTAGAPASLGGAVTGREGSGRDPKGRRIEKLAPGMMNYLEPGEEVTFAQPTGSGQFEQVWISTLMGMAAGAGLTYDQVTGDLRQANYSSLRAGKIEQRILTAQLQNHVLIPQMMRRVTEWFVEAAILGGVLSPRRNGWRFDFVLPAVEPIDPRKDLEADILAVRAGRMTPQEFIASWGQDWRKVIADTKAFFDLVDKEGLALDIDPRRVSQLGVAQPAVENEPEPAQKPKKP